MELELEIWKYQISLIAQFISIIWIISLLLFYKCLSRRYPCFIWLNSNARLGWRLKI